MASVLVTGASRGIGLATCLSLGRAGHAVFATMRNPEGAPELSAAANSESLPITVSAMDVNSDESVRGTVSEIIARHGPVDALVNNAWPCGRTREQRRYRAEGLRGRAGSL